MQARGGQNSSVSLPVSTRASGVWNTTTTTPLDSEGGVARSRKRIGPSRYTIDSLRAAPSPISAGLNSLALTVRTMLSRGSRLSNHVPESGDQARRIWKMVTWSVPSEVVSRCCASSRENRIVSADRSVRNALTSPNAVAGALLRWHATASALTARVVKRTGDRCRGTGDPFEAGMIPKRAVAAGRRRHQMHAAAHAATRVGGEEPEA